MPTPPEEKPLSADAAVVDAKTTPATAANGAPKEGAANALTAKTVDAVLETAGSATYTVAPGRTVSHGEDHACGKDGQIKTIGRMRTFKAGEKIKLDENEARRLLELGFILDEDGSIVVRADGPAINVDNGVQIAQERA